MQYEGSTEELEASGLPDLGEQAPAARERGKRGNDPAEEVRDQATSARDRAALAKKRELATHARAIELHEQAAILQERLGHPDRAAQARKHADHARESLAKGRAEQRVQEERGR